jgi:hypothetical protein
VPYPSSAYCLSIEPSVFTNSVEKTALKMFITRNAALVLRVEVQLRDRLLHYTPKHCRRHSNTAFIRSDLDGNIFGYFRKTLKLLSLACGSVVVKTLRY